MSPETESTATLFDFARYLRKHIYELADGSTPEFSQDERYKLHSLGGAVEELMMFAQETGDRPLYDILDDFDYAVKECGMGAPSKGKFELDKGAFKLDEYEHKRTNKPAS